MKFGLKELVKDSVTGFAGVITARCEYLDGDTRYQVEEMVSGKPVQQWFDEGRLKLDLAAPDHSPA